MSNPNPDSFSQQTHDCAQCNRFAAPANASHCADCAAQARRDARQQDPNPDRRF